MERDITGDMREILLKAKARDGDTWEMVLGELQLQFGEACLWVLVDNPAQAYAALHALRDIVAPYMQKWQNVNFTATFYAIEKDEKLFIDLLDGPGIVDDRTLSTIGNTVERSRLSATDIFVSERRRRLGDA